MTNARLSHAWSRYEWAAALALGLTILGIALASRLSADVMADFRAFWCAGVVLVHHANPYLQQPLQQCEQLAGPPWEGASLRQVALPAPLPPFALLAFASLSVLPFSVAMIVYGVLLTAAMTLAVFLLSRVTGAPLFVVAVTLSPIAWSDAILRGQPFAVVLLAFAASAYLMQRSRPAAAACCLLVATVQPHVALPALLGALVLVRRMRRPLLVGGLALAGASVVMVGPAVTAVYIRDVLPAHASANAYEWQFSLTSLLTSIGIAARPAIAAGSLTFATMTLLGVVAAARFVHRDGEVAAAVLIPPAFAVFLGVHVHYHQLALAFPAILFVLVRYERWRSVAGAGLVAAMLPWDTIIAPFLIGVWTILAAIVGRFVYGPRPALWIAAGSALFAVGISLAAFLHPALGGGETTFTPHPYPPDGIAEESWSDYSRQVLSRTSPLFIALRAPTILGLFTGLIAVAGAAFAKTRHPVRGHARVIQHPTPFVPTKS